MPSDSDADSAKDEVPSVAPQSDAHSEEGEASEDDSPGGSYHGRSDSAETPTREPPEATEHSDAPPLPDEPLPAQSNKGDGTAPPLPHEVPPQQEDDGWDAMWDPTRQAWYFYNRFTGMSQWDNPRIQTATASGAPPSAAIATAATATASQPTSVAGGYNPAIHGSWDPNAPYAQAYKQAVGVEDETPQYPAEVALEAPVVDPYAQVAAFNSRTGKFQAADKSPEQFSDAAKSQRQMNAYFDVDRAANSHDGRSLKAERRGKQPTKKELAQWKEKRKARKEEKRRAWLRD